MVTIQEARQQLQTKQRQAASQIKQIEATRLPAQTRRELAKATPQTQAKYKAEQKQLEAAKQKAVTQIREYETKQLKPYEEQIQKAEEQVRASQRQKKIMDFIKTKPVYGYLLNTKEMKRKGFTHEEIKSIGKYLSERRSREERIANLPSWGTNTKLSEIQASKIEGGLEEVKVSKKLSPFDVPVSEFEKAMGKTFQGVPLVTDVKTGLTKPAWESVPDFEKTVKDYPIIEISKKGIGLSIPGVIGFFKKTPSPQEVITEKIKERQIDLTKQRGPLGDIARFEKVVQERKRTETKTEKDLQKALQDLNKATTNKEQQKALENLKKAGGSYKVVNGNIEITTPTRKKAYGTVGTLAGGIWKDLREGTKAYAEKVTTTIEKQVTKLPYETRKKIAEKPGQYFKAGALITYEKTGIKKGIEFMKVTPAPSEYKWVKKTIGKEPILTEIETAYQKEVKEGVREPGRTKFFIEKLGKGYEEAGRGISETYFRAKEGKLVSPWIKTKEPSYEYLPETKITGKVSKLVGQTSLYIVPTVGTTVIVAPFAEATGRRELKKYVTEHKLETVFAGLWIGGKLVMGGIKFGKYMKKPIYTKLPKPKPRYTAMDVIEPVKKGERVIEKGRYVIRRDIPARKAEVITRWGKITGKKPTIIKITKPRTDYAFTPRDIIIEKGVIKEGMFVSKRVTKIPEKGYYTWFEYGAEQKPLTLEGFKKLSKLERYKLQQLAEAKVGRAIPEEYVPQILGKDFQYSRGYIEAEKLGKLRLKGTRIDIRTPTPGKTIYRGDITTMAQEVTPEKLKEIGFRIYKTRTVAKDVTKPFTRATGTLPDIKGITLVKPLKDITPKDSYILPKTLQQIQRTKLSPQTVQALEQAKLTAIKTFPKQRPVIKLPITKPSPILTTQQLAPRMVGGGGLEVSEYAGPTYAPPEEITYVYLK